MIAAVAPEAAERFAAPSEEHDDLDVTLDVLEAAFSRATVATSPAEAAHLIVGFLDQAGTPEEVTLVLSGLPEPAQRFVPAMRDQARAALAVLSGATEG